MTKKIKRNALAYAMVLPSFLIVAVVVAYPIVNAVIRSFSIKDQPGVYGLDNYVYIFTNKLTSASLRYTLFIVIVTVLVATVISYGLALYVRFARSRASKVIGALYLLPRFIPGMVAVNAVITVIRDGGLISRIGQALGMDWSLGWMYDAKGIILMNLWFNIPFATMLLMAALSEVQDAHIESARDAGSGKLAIFTRILLPLTTKDIFIAATFIFMGNVGSYTTPYLMGGNFPTMMGVSLYQQFNKYQYERAAAMSVVMFLICLVSAAVYIYTNMKPRVWERQ